jgi:Plasmid pRiA4b ORF-3-like protein
VVIFLALASQMLLLVVSETSIAELHKILQSAFGWSGEHLHRFLVHGATFGIPHLGGIAPRSRKRGQANRTFAASL